MTEENKKEQPKETKDSGKVSSIGAVLCKERRAQKVTFEAVAEATKIREVFIRAIEDNAFEKLPGGIYTKGYIRKYAEFLEVDPDPLILEFSNIGKSKSKKEDFTPEVYRDEFSPSPLVIVISIIALIVVYAVWAQFSDDKEAQKGATSATHEEKVLKAYTASEHTINLVAKSVVNLTVLKVDGSIFHEQVMAEGDTYFVPTENEGLIVKVDNMQAIEIYVNGDAIASTDNLEQKNGGLVIDVNKLLANLVIK